MNKQKPSKGCQKINLNNNRDKSKNQFKQLNLTKSLRHRQFKNKSRPIIKIKNLYKNHNNNNYNNNNKLNNYSSLNKVNSPKVKLKNLR